MSLKTANLPLYYGFFIIVYYMFCIINQIPIASSVKIVIEKGNIEFGNPIFTIALPIIAIVINNILTSNMKARLVYLKWKNPLPGARVFTRLAHTDQRISLHELEEKYGTLPTDPTEQNRLWYKIYREKEKDKVINSSHGIWLLLRDMYCTFIILAFPMIVYSAFFFGTNKAIQTGIFSLVGLIIIMISARNSGNRFVCNVLAR